jgi:anaerobic selenocysteine-containing dehydrogenase
MAQNENLSDEKVVKTLCPMCIRRDGIEVHLRGNRIVKIAPNRENPSHHLCMRALAVPEVAYSADRLRYPLKKVNGHFERISWDAALDFISEKLFSIKEKYGPEALALYYGHTQVAMDSTGLIRFWAEAYGTANIGSASHLCYVHQRTFVGHVTFGRQIQMGSVAGSKCVLNWGRNSHYSQTNERHLWASMKDQGVKVVVIDPRLTHEAKMSDLHLRPRIGTDWSLALGFINVIISEKLYDKDFVDQWTVGFDQLAKAIVDYQPQKVEAITGVPAKDIEQAARMYATIKPACINSGLATYEITHSFQVGRVLSILMAITGNIDVAGGNLLAPQTQITARPLLSEKDDQEYRKTAPPTFTAGKYPLFEEVLREPLIQFLPETILTKKPYPIKGFMVIGGNPMRSFADTNKVRQALKELEFVAVMDIFMTDMAKVADIVLPAATHLESNHANNDKGTLRITDKVIDPPGECWSPTKFWIELAKRMGFEKSIPWKDDEEFLESICRSVGKSLKEVRGLSNTFVPRQRRYKTYEKEGFDTPSRKVELYSESLEKWGIPPLPVPYYEEPTISPMVNPELAREYPLIGIIGPRVEEYEHTWGHNIPLLRSRVPDPLCQIHPKDAERYGVEDGEWFTIESPKGQVKMKAKVTDDMMEGVTAMPFGWGGECNANMLTSAESAEKPVPVMGGIPCKNVRCRIKSAQSR